MRAAAPWLDKRAVSMMSLYFEETGRLSVPIKALVGENYPGSPPRNKHFGKPGRYPLGERPVDRKMGIVRSIVAVHPERFVFDDPALLNMRSEILRRNP